MQDEKKHKEQDLMVTVKGMNTMLIHLAAATLNREVEGLGVVGGAAATYLRGGVEVTSHDWVIGLELTQFDADTYVLARAVEVLALCYTAEVAPPSSIYLFCLSSPALQAIQNPRSTKAHSFVLCFHKALTTFFLHHRGRIVLCWAPKDDQLEGNWLTRSLASQVCRRDIADLPDGMDRIQSAAFQKDRARRQAFHQWELDYQLAQSLSDQQAIATGTPSDGVAYQYVISQPPSKINHPLWSAAVAMEKDEQGGKTQHPLFVTVSPSPQPEDMTEEKLHTLWKYARDFRHQHTTDAEYVWDESDDEDYSLAIGCLVVT
jgi:hypothetical protein